jgi:hypothetical protein
METSLKGNYLFVKVKDIVEWLQTLDDKNIEREFYKRMKGEIDDKKNAKEN